jgi:DNA-binding MarR family transcriptional regulator
VSQSRSARERSANRATNLLGALALAVGDRMRVATEDAARHTAAAPAALVALHEFLAGASMDDLRKVVGLTPSGAVRLVDRLVADGYVQRRPGANARALSLVLTAPGHRAARRVLSARSATLTAALGELSDADLRAFERVCEKLLRTLAADRLADRARGRPPPGGYLCRLCDFTACGRERGDCPVTRLTTSAGPTGAGS